jgi:hypothetical protein
MPQEPQMPGTDERWAQFRFSVIGPLLAAPPRRGELGNELKRLARTSWRHPISGQPVQFGLSTIERWYYKALKEPKDPIGVLARKVREDHGTHPSLRQELRAELLAQYRQHPNWSYQLHADNLAARVAMNPKLGVSFRSACRTQAGFRGRASADREILVRVSQARSRQGCRGRSRAASGRDRGSSGWQVRLPLGDSAMRSRR